MDGPSCLFCVCSREVVERKEESFAAHIITQWDDLNKTAARVLGS